MWTDESEDESSNELATPSIKSKPDHSPCKYLSHENEVASQHYIHQQGTDFGPEHEIWEYLSAGDSISVYAYAIYPAWTCNGKEAELKVRRKFEPICITRQES